MYILILAGLLVFSENGFAKSLTEKALFQRCYSQITGSRPKSDNPLWLQLNSKKAINICLELLFQTKLRADGRVDISSSVQKDILRQFHDLHRSWLPKQFQGTYELSDSLGGAVDVIEPAESAYFITRALFTDGYHYREVLRGKEALAGIRDPATASAAGSPTGFKRATRASFGAYDGDVNFDLNSHTMVVPKSPNADLPPYDVTPVELVSVGTLLGIRTRSDSATVSRLITRYGTAGGIINEASLVVPYNVRANLGGGALGTQGLLIYNFGHGFNYVTNGTDKLPRNWMAAGMKAFLCSEGPYLFDSDVQSYVRTGTTVPAFRSQTSCLKCHATLDQASMTARNLVLASTGMLTTTFVRSTATVASYSVTAGSEPGQEFWPAAPVASFKNQSPAGKFLYRSFKGNLINRDVANLNELGIVISETEDFYACAAKRYVEYFTGIKVPLRDTSIHSPGDPSYEKEKAWREYVIALGQELKVTGSLKTLVKRILESDYYRQSDFGR